MSVPIAPHLADESNLAMERTSKLASPVGRLPQSLKVCKGRAGVTQQVLPNVSYVDKT
jgi:hypothetical protein